MGFRRQTQQPKLPSFPLGIPVDSPTSRLRSAHDKELSRGQALHSWSCRWGWTDCHLHYPSIDGVAVLSPNGAKKACIFVSCSSCDPVNGKNIKWWQLSMKDDFRSVIGLLITLLALVIIITASSISYFAGAFLLVLYNTTLLANLHLALQSQNHWASFTKDTEEAQILLLAPNDRWAVYLGRVICLKWLPQDCMSIKAHRGYVERGNTCWLRWCCLPHSCKEQPYWMGRASLCV